ncbi:MAG: glycosyltransferase [Anaerolineales bacterium]|nr:glycosyltransferase [Anaerolineales bacterium]
MTLMMLAQIVYVFSASVLAVYGLNMFVLTLLSLGSRAPRSGVDTLSEWPHVTVQLPLFNESLVVERLVDSIAGLDYPCHSFSIQILDDSTDQTTELAQQRVDYYRNRGVDITCLHRSHRIGNKAGALAVGLSQAAGDFVAVFDADFIPKPDFLKRVMPHFSSSQVGMVQTRWGHLNATCSVLARAQALALDGHMVVEQAARSANGLLFNFNGSAGVWRRDCIESSGGWQSDTLAEDLDLSYRAQMGGWTFIYLPDVVTPAEVPLRLLDYKKQQFRWVKGSVQCLLKHTSRLFRSQFSVWKRFQGLLHLGGYLMHPMMLCLLLGSLPVVLLGSTDSVLPGLLGIAGLGPPTLYAVSQISAYPLGIKRALWFPVLLLLGVGVALNNTRAVLEALTGQRPDEFLRTPKIGVGPATASRYESAHTVDWSTWVEFGLACYAVVAAVMAWLRMPSLAPLLLLFAFSFLSVAVLGLFESVRAAQGT